MRRALASAAAALLLAGCGAGSTVGREEPEPPSETLTIATGGKGGIYAVYGAELAKEITRRLDGYRGRALETTGSVQNLLRVRDGKAQIALTLGDTALDAVEGREAFDRPVGLRALAQIYPSYVQLVTTPGAGIRTLRDLADKRVSTGSPDSGTEVVAERMLDVAGVAVPARERLGVAESAQALADGKIDAFFWSGGVPTGAITDLSKRMPLALVDLGRLTREMRTRWGGVYERAPVPAGTYGLAAAVPTVTIPNYVVVDEHMDPGLAQDLTRLVAGRDLSRAQRVIAPVGLHQGAQDYYDHAGP
jgi:TRAP transporter TAXI family solute receptor